MTFSEWSKVWLKVHSQSVCHQQQLNQHYCVVHLCRYLGDKELSCIKPFDIDTLLSDLATYNPNTSKPMSKRYLREIRDTCWSIFEYAIENGITDKNPASRRKLPRSAPESKRRALTQEEQQLILCSKHTFAHSALIMMLCGLRRGELIPLRWDDIDTKRKTIKIYKSVEEVNGSFRVKDGTKTNAGRTVPIPDRIVDILVKERALSCSSFVSCNGSCDMHTPSTWKACWTSYIRDLQKEYGCDITFTPHILRHTYATILYNAGVDVLTAAKLLGHSNVKTTIAIYTHLAAETEILSISKFNTYIDTVF